MRIATEVTNNQTGVRTMSAKEHMECARSNSLLMAHSFEKLINSCAIDAVVERFSY